MASVTTSIKIDSKLKKDAQELFESLGLNLSSAINIFLRQSVREQAIPFRIGEPVFSEETRKAVEDARNGTGLSREFSTVSELMDELNTDE